MKPDWRLRPMFRRARDVRGLLNAREISQMLKAQSLAPYELLDVLISGRYSVLAVAVAEAAGRSAEPVWARLHFLQAPVVFPAKSTVQLVTPPAAPAYTPGPAVGSILRTRAAAHPSPQPSPSPAQPAPAREPAFSTADPYVAAPQRAHPRPPVERPAVRPPQPSPSPAQPGPVREPAFSTADPYVAAPQRAHPRPPVERPAARTLKPFPGATKGPATGDPEGRDFSLLWQWQRLRQHPRSYHRALAVAWARSILELHDDWLLIDTETTGLSSRDQVIEIAIAAPVRQRGRWRLNTVLEQRMRPSVPLGDSSAIHGITERYLHHSPTFREVADQIRSVMHGKHLLAWNAPFDCAAINRTALAWQTMPVVEDQRWHCAMRAHAVWAGDTTGRNLYRYQKLGGDHSALGDVQCMLDRIVSMATSDS